VVIKAIKGFQGGNRRRAIENALEPLPDPVNVTSKTDPVRKMNLAGKVGGGSKQHREKRGSWERKARVSCW